MGNLPILVRMALGLAALQAVVELLRKLKTESPSSFVAISDRITLVREQPDHPRAKGVVRRLPDGTLARCCSIPSPDGEWLLVWVLDDGDPPKVRLIVLAQADR